jgi:hypothetical protein
MRTGALSAHERFSDANSARTCRLRQGIPRSISAEGLSRIAAFHTEPVKILVTVIIVREHMGNLLVWERIAMDDLRKEASIHLNGRCRVQPSEFPVKDGIEVLCIPSSVHCVTLSHVFTTQVVLDLIHQGKKYRIQCLPDLTDDQLIEVAMKFMGTPSSVRLPIKRPTRTDDEIQVWTAAEIQRELMMLEAL